MSDKAASATPREPDSGADDTPSVWVMWADEAGEVKAWLESDGTPRVHKRDAFPIPGYFDAPVEWPYFRWARAAGIWMRANSGKVCQVDVRAERWEL